jgi:hypothetical protein
MDTSFSNPAALKEDTLFNSPVVPASSKPRRAPKHSCIRGVDFPEFADVIAPDGPDGPATTEQIAVAMGEITRIGGRLDQTVTGWSGLHLTEVNSATMDSVIEILRNWRKN